MARSNKYTSLNFNEIFEKKLNNNINPAASSSFSSSNSAFANQSKNILSNSRIHGHMLVLSRPAKPVSTNPNPEDKEKGSPLSPTPLKDQPRIDPEPNDISLRPQGRTGSGTLPSATPLVSPVKPDRFVPPHLRPGFVGKEDNLGSEFVKGGPATFKAKSEVGGHRPGQVQSVGVYGSRSNRYGEDGRPKSGGGYEQIRRGGEPTHLNRSGPSENRPSSSG